MNAKVVYRMAYIPHPWDPKLRKSGINAWCLVKVVKPEFGNEVHEPVAIFNLNSEAETFQGHVFASGQDGSLVDIDRTQREIFETYKRNDR